LLIDEMKEIKKEGKRVGCEWETYLTTFHICSSKVLEVQKSLLSIAHLLPKDYYTHFYSFVHTPNKNFSFAKCLFHHHFK